MAAKKKFFDSSMDNVASMSLRESIDKKKYAIKRVFDSPVDDAQRDDDKAISKEESKIISVPTSSVFVVGYKKDRYKLTDDNVRELADSMKNNGQLQPCRVRENENEFGQKYELIFGERRLKAATLAGIHLKVVVENVNDSEASIEILSENKDRENNTDFEQYLQIKEILNRELLTQKDIVQRVGINKQRVSRLMSYEKIPKELNEAIGDFQKVTCSTAEVLAALSADDKNIQHLVNIADKIASGSLGNTRIRRYIDRINALIDADASEKEDNRLITDNGLHVATRRKDGNECFAYHLTRPITDMFKSQKIFGKEFNKELTALIGRYVENAIKNGEKTSPSTD